MVAVPLESPVTIPVGSTVPTAVLLLLQAPPATDSVKADVRPTHTVWVPVIAAGTAFTVTAVILLQPALSV